MVIRLPDGKGTVELSGGVVVLRCARGAVILERDAWAAMSGVTEPCDGCDYSVLVEVTGISRVDRAARTVPAGPWPVARVAILGASPYLLSQAHASSPPGSGEGSAPAAAFAHPWACVFFFRAHAG